MLMQALNMSGVNREQQTGEDAGTYSSESWRSTRMGFTSTEQYDPAETQI
jgi:hypothetical protein